MSVTPVTGSLIPEFTFLLTVPSRPDDLLKRDHNRFAKEACRVMMEKHHAEHVPLHFKRGARARYNYRPRDPKYIRKKQKRFKRGGMDLVKTGRTRSVMESQYRLRIGGTASNQTLTPRLILRFPFKGGTGKFRGTARGNRGAQAVVTIQQMIREMEAFHRDEVPRLAQWFHDEYWRLVHQHRGVGVKIRARGANGRFLSGTG